MVGVDVLGFPQFHTVHFEDYEVVNSKFFKAYSK